MPIPLKFPLTLYKGSIFKRRFSRTNKHGIPYSWNNFEPKIIVTINDIEQLVFSLDNGRLYIEDDSASDGLYLYAVLTAVETDLLIFNDAWYRFFITPYDAYGSPAYLLRECISEGPFVVYSSSTTS